MRVRQPTAFLPHGGGPWPLLRLPMLPDAEADALEGFLRGLPGLLPARPDAILVVSAHWECAQPTVNTHPRPPMLFDYYGFPPDAYTLRWPAPGAPELSRRAAALLSAGGLPVAEEPDRGFDHGTFLPLMLAWPDADIPVAQLSLVNSLDPRLHRAMGAVLAPLRDEGVFIVGSGNSYHNMHAFLRGGDAAARDARQFDAWLAETVTSPPGRRDQRLDAWADAPAARRCHPREEHLLPLMAAAGAAGADTGRVAWRGTMGGMTVSGVLFGGA